MPQAVACVSEMVYGSMTVFETQEMSTLPEFVGTIHIFLGPYRGNPIALYGRNDGESCHISPTAYPWNRIVGVGETMNKAAAHFEAQWKEGGLSPEMYSGPHWEGGIKPEKPKPVPPPKPASPPSPEAPPAAPAPSRQKTRQNNPSILLNNAVLCGFHESIKQSTLNGITVIQKFRMPLDTKKEAFSRRFNRFNHSIR